MRKNIDNKKITVDELARMCASQFKVYDNKFIEIDHNFASVRRDLNDLRTEIRNEFSSIRSDLKSINVRFDNMLIEMKSVLSSLRTHDNQIYDLEGRVNILEKKAR